MPETISVSNPARHTEIVGEIAACSAAQVDEALAIAHHACDAWSQTTPEERSERLTAAAKELTASVDPISVLFVRENGKPLKEAERDVRRSIELVELTAAELPAWWRSEVYDSVQPVEARRRARGVTAVISPWNSPVLLTFKRMIPALAAGNTVIVKPPSYCPLALAQCVRILAQALPKGVLRLVPGSGSAVGEKLAADPRVRTVAFTGSTETGRRIMELASRTIKKIFLELGGNDPALVFDDASLDEAAIGRLTNAVLRAAGQVCVAVKRIYVHASRYDELLEKLRASFDRVTVGDGLSASTTMGPLNNRPQFDFVQGLLLRARDSGQQILTAGRKADDVVWDAGYFMLPRLIPDARHGAEIVSCEQFGPVVPLIKFSDENDAVRMANDSEFGLRASLWTADRRRAARIADRLQAGAVFYNSHGIFQDLHLEFPGVKQSGFSRESRHAGLDHYADTYGFAG